MIARLGGSQGPAARALLIRRGVERRPVVLVAAAALFVGIFALRQEVDTGSGLALLYVLPISLVALELGLVAGLAAAALATGLVIVWSATTSWGLDALGVSTRAAVFAVAGLTTGRFSDRMRRLQLVQEQLISAGIDLARLEDIGELNELVAHHASRLPGVIGARVTIGNEQPSEFGRDGAQPLRLPLDRHDPPGATLEVTLRGGSGEEQAALEMLALQASVARENQRLLEREQERAALQAALAQAHDRLTQHRMQLRHVFETQERERSDVAYTLHEEAAQVLAAVLLGLDMAQREVGSTLSASRIADLRSHLDATLGSLRELAVSLRAPVLDAMGLGPALEHLAEDGTTPGLERIDVELGALSERLAPELETAIFRVVEDATRTTEDGRTVDVRYDAEAQELQVLVRLVNGGTLGNLAALRARVELLDGSVDAESDRLTAHIPLGARDRGGAFPTPHTGSARMR